MFALWEALAEGGAACSRIGDLSFTCYFKQERFHSNTAGKVPSTSTSLLEIILFFLT